MTAPTRPVLRYHGGKWRIAPWIISHFPEHRIYVEPFGGGGSVLMRKERAFAEVYNDLDDEVVTLFRVLRDSASARELQRVLELTPWSRTEFNECFEPAAEPLEVARRVVVRAYMAFGTSSRRRSRTGFRGKAYRNNQTGAQDWSGFPACLPAFVERLQGVTIECRDALSVIAQQDGPDTLFYVDPPYPHSTRTSVGHKGTAEAYRHEMTDDDHRRLAIALRSTSGCVVLSGYACGLYDAELYADWDRHERDVRADGAKARTEVLWVKPAGVQMPAPDSLVQSSFALENALTIPRKPAQSPVILAGGSGRNEVIDG